jgi:hypothetical protein
MMAIAGPQIIAGGALAPPALTSPPNVANNHERGSGHCGDGHAEAP